MQFRSAPTAGQGQQAAPQSSGTFRSAPGAVRYQAPAQSTPAPAPQPTFFQNVLSTLRGAGSYLKGQASYAVQNPKQAAVNVANGLISNERGLASSASAPFEAGILQKQNTQSAELQSQTNQNILAALKKTNDPSIKQKLLDLYKRSNAGNQPIDVNQAVPALNNTPLQVAGQAAGTFLDLATLGGTGAEAKTAAELGSKGLLKRIVSKEGLTATGKAAGTGYGYDVANKLQEGKTNAKEVLKPGLNALAMPLLHVGGEAATAGLQRVGAAIGTKKALNAAAKDTEAFSKNVLDIAKENGAEAHTTDVKGFKRSLQKVVDDYKDNPKMMRDANRSTIDVSSQEQYDKVLKSINDRYNVTRVKDNFTTAKPGDYKSVIVNVEMPGGREAEIQITTPAMTKAKYEAGGDALSKKLRSLKPGSDEYIATEKKMRDVYQKADQESNLFQNRPQGVDNRAALNDSALAADKVPNSASEILRPSEQALSGSQALPKSLTANTAPEASTSTLTGTSSTSKNLGNVSSGIKSSITQTGKEITVPRSQLPVGGSGETKVSRLAARVSDKLGAITPEERAKLPEYEAMTHKDQLQKAAAFVESNPKDALAILRGDKPAPEGLLHGSIFLAAEQKAIDSGDATLIRDLASLRATRAGQELSILAARDTNSPVKYLDEVKQARYEIKGGEEKVKKQVKQTVKEGMDVIKKTAPKKAEWSAFLDEIRCK